MGTWTTAGRPGRWGTLRRQAAVPKYRWIGRATSDDFVHWSQVVPMDPGAAPFEHLYTSQTHPYFRAPHIYIAFPRRFLPGQQVLSEDQVRSLGLEEPGEL